MKKYTGILGYTSLFKPVRLNTEVGVLDLRDYLFPVLTALNGQNTTMKQTKESFSLRADKKSTRVI